MPIDAEKEISRLWKSLHVAQDEIGKTYYRWRQVAIEMAGENANPLEIALHAADTFGRDIGKNFLPRLNWLKGEEAFLLNLGNAMASLWNAEGALAGVEKGEKDGEVFIRCTRDPWPTYAKAYGVPMEEVALCREKLFQAILEDVGIFFNIALGLEMQKAIPRGEGEYLIRLYKKE